MQKYRSLASVIPKLWLVQDYYYLTAIDYSTGKVVWYSTNDIRKRPIERPYENNKRAILRCDKYK